MNKKIRVAIDINEILRAKWLQFDRFYAQEFGEGGVPEQPYLYDYFGEYKFDSVIEIEKELKEPEEIPDNINPVYYQVKDGEDKAMADDFLFKSPIKTELSSLDVYNRFMYIDYCFEIFGAASMMYRNMDLDVNKFINKYEDTVDFTIYSIENYFSIPATLFFLSKINTRFSNIKFVKDSLEMWNSSDVIITTDPKLLSLGTPWGKKMIKLTRPYNENIKKTFNLEVLQLNDLTENKKFEKIIKYNKK